MADNCRLGSTESRRKNKRNGATERGAISRRALLKKDRRRGGRLYIRVELVALNILKNGAAAPLED